MGNIPKIDEFLNIEDNVIFKKTSKDIIQVPFKRVFGQKKYKDLENFVTKPKRTYSNKAELYCKYINYFIKYFDEDNELLCGYLDMKFLIDRKETYSKKLFINDLYEYILSDTMIEKIQNMTEYNYIIDLDGNFESRSNQKNNDSIKITNEQGKILLNISTAMKITIPIITHYMHVYCIKNVDKFISRCFDDMAGCFEGENDICNKLYQMITSRINYTINSEKGHWSRIEIEGLDPLSETDSMMNKIMVNIINKYEYDKNIVFYNIGSINKMIEHIRRTKSQLNYSMMGVKKDQDGLSDKVLSLNSFNCGKVLLGLNY